MRRAVVALLLCVAGCSVEPPRATEWDLRYVDDVDAGVRCYAWAFAGATISCVVLPHHESCGAAKEIPRP